MFFLIRNLRNTLLSHASFVLKPHATIFHRLEYPFSYVFFSPFRPFTHLYQVVALCETMNLERKYSYPHPLFHPPQCFSPKTNGKHAVLQNQVLRLRSAEVKPLDESGQRRIYNCLYHEKGAKMQKIKPLLFFFSSY